MNESYSITSDIMQNLKQGFDICRFSNGRLEPCDYHRNRAETLIIGVMDGGGCETSPLRSKIHHRQLVCSNDVRRLLGLLSSDGHVTGGWWLVGEQRQWLHRRFAKLFAQYNGRPCRVMVSGVAGYAHFYSYMHILFDAAKETGFDISGLSVDIVDTCITPLLEIAVIENSIRYGRQWGRSGIRAAYDIMGYKFPVPSANRRFIKSIAADIRKCTISVVHNDILDIHEKRNGLTDSYDIITEHFLISMMENVLPLVDRSRMTYSNLLRPGGHLLMACGFSDMNFIECMLKIHAGYGFSPDENDMVKVWDPFGISRSELQQMSNGGNAPTVALDNCMIDFTLGHQPDRHS
ncbi:MAG TPA: hypothetical protein IAC86_00145 [Candidatus Cryptobacteroides excrementigallinarum]|nr:hypothetical protein [Candidatus Cryptobacteroides excrementigallinarum]